MVIYISVKRHKINEPAHTYIYYSKLIEPKQWKALSVDTSCMHCLACDIDLGLRANIYRPDNDNAKLASLLLVKNILFFSIKFYIYIYINLP